MVKLTNIRYDKETKYIECNYYPNLSKEAGYAKLNTEDLDDFSIVKSNYDMNCDSFSIHVIYTLRKLTKSLDNLPKERTVMWY